MKLRIASMIASVLAVALGPAESALAHNEVPSVTVREGQPFAEIWIYPDCPVTMSYRTENDTAKARQRPVGGRATGGDYRETSGHTITGGAHGFRIPIINDAVRERTETMRVIVDITTSEVFLFVAAAGCAYGTPTFQTIEATVTILDND